MGKHTILHLIAPTILGGAERVVINNVELLDNNKFTSVIGCFVSVKRLDNLFVKELEKRHINHHMILMKSTFDLKNIYQIITLIQRNNIDILHTHGYRSDIIGLICAKITGHPIISTVHGWTPTTFKVRIYEMFDRIALFFFNYIVSVSKEIELSLLRSHISKTKIKLIPNAISCDKMEKSGYDIRKELGINKSTRIIGTIARLSKEKGIEYLLEAFIVVQRAFRDTKLLIVGEGGEKDKLVMLSNKECLRGNVIFYGFESDVGKIYSNIDVFVLSSISEGTPMSLLEAMAFGVPVVATNVGEVSNIINNDINGILVEARDVKGLAAGILDILFNPEKAKRMIIAGRETIELRYNSKKWIKEIEEIYSKF